MPTNIDSTIHVLKGQLNATAVQKGTQMISKWEADLERADWLGAKTIHADLVKLRHHLEGGKLDGATIAKLLIKLGESTERAAVHTKDDTIGHLKSLSQALVKASESLR